MITTTRRKFLQSTTTAFMLPSLQALATPQPAPDVIPGYQLKILATNWGFNGTIDEYCAKVRQEGYDGIEIWWPTEKPAADALFAALKKYGLEVGFLTGGQEDQYAQHLETFKKMITAAAHNTIQRPLYINCHSGRDHFSYKENKNFIDYTVALAKETGIKICHETHRSRMLYSAPIAKHFIEENPALRITLDISHWCNVHESLLHDQKETVGLTLQRVDHIHARIGHPEGPQVNDPRAPEWDAAVKAHFAWWDQVVEMKKKSGEVLTVLTEFGPPDYMPTEPYTRTPLSDQWQVNVYMMQQFRTRYS
jgi:sugar phosphate isomerase/epimerase